MTTEPTLDSILSGKATAAAPDPTPQVDEPEALVTDPVKNEVGTEHVEGEAALDEAKPDGEAKDKPDDKTGAAFKGQREGLTKRYTEQVADFQRKLEEQEAKWQARFDQIMQQRGPMPPPQQPAQTPDMFADPDGYTKHIERAVNERTTQLALDFDLKLARATHKDVFDQAWTSFLGTVKAGDNALYGEVMNSSSPGEAIVNWYKRDNTLREVGTDPEAYKAKLRAEILAELQGQQPASAPQTAVQGQPAAAPALPSNFADARNAGARTGQPWQGPPPLKDIFHKG